MTVLQPSEVAQCAAFREFAQAEIAPLAAQIDHSDKMPAELVRGMAARGFLGALVEDDSGARPLTMVAFGLLCEELARASMAVQSLVTVHSMVCCAVARSGSDHLKRAVLPALASGERIGAFALTEDGAGSDISAIAAVATRTPTGYVINGVKSWISFATLCDWLLVFVRIGGDPAAFLVPSDAPGVAIEMAPPLSALRGAGLAHVHLVNVAVEMDQLVGPLGLRTSHVAARALTYGRFCVAWAAVGVATCALEDSARHAGSRKQFGQTIGEHQLVRRRLADALADVESARLACLRAGRSHDCADPDAIEHTLLAKYIATRAATRVTGSAVQILGARGLQAGTRTERCWRDARALEIIEGSTEILQLLLGAIALQEHGRAR